MADQRVMKWQRWCEDRIYPDVIDMHSNRRVFRTVLNIAKANKGLPESMYWDFFRQTYAQAQAMAVRRQAEVDPRDSCSLGTLISQIKAEPERISRRFWVGLFSDENKIVGERGFTDQYAGPDGDHLDPRIPAADLARLRQTARRVKRYADKHVAHSDKKPGKGLPTFHDLNDAVDVVGELLTKYLNMLTASSLMQLEPVPQYDWLALFREPWIPKGTPKSASFEP